MSKKKGLGRGLNALLSDSNDERLEVDIPVAHSSVAGGILEIPLGQIEVNPFQPRSLFDPESLQANSPITNFN
jgi:ParB family chromosome partitioning protein